MKVPHDLGFWFDVGSVGSSGAGISVGLHFAQ